ncbi:hypothetical protein HK097_011569 [Rhizophlyctis rosea]|uniref:RNA ligase domain-containing protein n=1 Tax=Rhizophlyctis rosea TaxID=64517 RepID=A0AAD5X8I2_9FUNG|nr:hypothetical protein HK097_011569 [Rhizophlyctis rosea]
MVSVEQPLPLGEAVRSLASVQTISHIHHHPDADRLDIVSVRGWQVVVLRGAYDAGDKIIFIEIDSQCPKDAIWAAPLAPKHYRVSTIKLRGELSQGFIVPLSVLPTSQFPDPANLPDDTDVTETLGITKHVPIPQKQAREINQSQQQQTPTIPFPKDLIPKTDEPRIQSFPRLLDEICGLPYYISVKYDGSSSTYFIDPSTHQFTVCSRNTVVTLPPGVTLKSVQLTKTTTIKDADNYWKPAILSDLPTKLATLYPHIALQAEVYGPGIQKNPLNVPHVKMAVFNAFNLTTHRYLDYTDLKRICHDLGVEMCEVVEEGDSFAVKDTATLIQMAKGKYRGTNTHREGIVVRPQMETRSRVYRDKKVTRLSFKAINNDFLLKGGS